MPFTVLSVPRDASMNPNSLTGVRIHGEVETEEEAKRIVKERNESDSERFYSYRSV